MAIRNKTCIDLLRFKKNNPLIFWLVTCYLIFLIIYFLIFLVFYADHSKAMALNELGDFLAGAFSPLAFLFLYLGYKQQGKELRQNTKALNMQAEELRISNKSLSQQVVEMEKSVKAQQDMFMLAERQYTDVLEEKQLMSKPKIELVTTKYKRHHDKFNDKYTHSFELDLKVLNASIRKFKIETTGYWFLNSKGSPRIEKTSLEHPYINASQILSLNFYKTDHLLPFQNNYLTIEYSDENGYRYLKQYTISLDKNSKYVEFIARNIND